MGNLTGPGSIAIGSSAVYQVDMYIPYPSASLSVAAFAPINISNVISVCGVKTKDTGVNYECGFDYKSMKANLFADGQTRGYMRGQLDLGVVTNKGVVCPCVMSLYVLCLMCLSVCLSQCVCVCVCARARARAYSCLFLYVLVTSVLHW